MAADTSVHPEKQLHSCSIKNLCNNKKKVTVQNILGVSLRDTNRNIEVRRKLNVRTILVEVTIKNDAVLDT